MQDKLVVKNLYVAYKKDGCDVSAVEDFNFKVEENEFICLLGPTGCGKTTVLNTIAGFIKPKKGEIMLNGEKVLEPIREIGVVFQNNALFPWRTVKENIQIGPRINGFSGDEVEKITAHYLQLIGLTKYAYYYPHELSGGMQQRVGIARALANNPEILLMDEPFCSLDAQTRAKMQEQLLELWHLHKKSIIFVTHDIDEALILSDRILLMSKIPGKIKKEIINTLPRPRSYKMTTEPLFIKQKKEIMEMLEYS